MNNKNNKYPTFSELNERLIQHGVEDVVSYLIGSGNYNRSSTSLSMGGYLGGKEGNSFQVKTQGTNIGMWYENNTAESPNDAGMGDLIELWSLVKNIDKGEAAKEIRGFLGMSFPSSSTPLKVFTSPKQKVEDKRKRLVKHISSTKTVSPNSINKYQRQLGNKPEALEYLHKRGLSDQTIKYFGIGLSNTYIDKHEVERSSALVFPLVTVMGSMVSPYAYYNVPGVTKNPITKNGWCSSSPRCSYNTEKLPSHDFLFIAEGFKDLWLLHQYIQGTDLENRLLIVTSTHGSRVPEEVQCDPLFFNDFTYVYCGQDADGAGDNTASSWSKFATTKSYRAKPPFKNEESKKDWTDFFSLAGNDINAFVQLLKNASQITTEIALETPKNLNDYEVGKTYSYDPVDINGAFVNGYLYYPVLSHEVGIDPETQTRAYGTSVKVVRSDGVACSYRQLPLLKRPDIIPIPLFALDDGTLISGPAKVSTQPSWEWHQVQAWREGKLKIRSIDVIINEIASILRGQIWLPNPDDHIILAIVVAVTYAQNIFDAVPLILATGVAGSGKSQLGALMAQVSCNGVVVGDTSAATITRMLDETRGFMVLDDIEKIYKSNKGSSSQNEDLLQILKVSYKKATATRKITEPKTMAVKTLNFYGVKFMTNTSGIEDILGTRTITIQTRKAINGFKPEELPFESFKGIRGELHAWAMESCTKLHEIYKGYSISERNEEILAPLRAISELAVMPEWQEKIDGLSRRLEVEQKSADSPTAYIKEAVWGLIKEGFVSMSIEQLVMEIKRIVPVNYGMDNTTDIPEWQDITWLRHQLVTMGYITRGTEKRFRPYGRVSAQRLYKFEHRLYEEIGAESQELLVKVKSLPEVEGTQYCKRHARCMECPYGDIDCEIRNKTTKR
jgi:hypothetical protein